MTGAANPTDRLYHQPLWGRTDPALRRSLAGSAALGALTLVLILLAPAVPPTPMTFEQVPDRIARLILEKPKPAAPPRTETARLEEVKPAEAPKPAAAKKPEPLIESAPPKTEVATVKPVQPPQRRAEPPRVAADQGVKGREQAAADVTANLKQVTGSLDKALGDLAQSLPKAGQSSQVTARGPGRRARSVREARSGDEVGGVAARTQLAAVDLEASAISGSGVSIAALTDVASGGGMPGGTGDGGGSGGAGVAGGGSDARSNASLLAVVRRYAAGIQFCYENELKRNPGLRGKLVFSLTVDAAGRVTDVRVVENGLAAPAVSDCALAQMREWKFPAVASGITTFRAPFMFTPPQ